MSDPTPKLQVFISSKMATLVDERKRIKATLDNLNINAWVYEEHAGARPDSIQHTYLEEIENADLYLGVFWKEYGEYTIEEYRHAVAQGKPCLIYEKRTEMAVPGLERAHRRAPVHRTPRDVIGAEDGKGGRTESGAALPEILLHVPDPKRPFLGPLNTTD